VTFSLHLGRFSFESGGALCKSLKKCQPERANAALTRLNQEPLPCAPVVFSLL
jgi:hypothetical protein